MPRRAPLRPLTARIPKVPRDPSWGRARYGSALVCAALVSSLVAAGCGAGDGASGDETGASRTTEGEPTAAGEDSPTGSRTAGSPTGSPVTSLPKTLTEQKPDWSECPAPNSAQGEGEGKPSPLPDDTTWECAELTVPLDYADPDGKTIRTEMIRAKKADNDKQRIGSLIFNFGGPGGSGVASLPSFGKEYDKLRSQYDLVSFDPRGVGRSEGLECASGEKLDEYFAAEWTPDNKKEEKALYDRQAAFARACNKSAEELLPHLTTENTARDMDLMRQVLGDEKLHYFGFSYGTELGGVYAHLFPEKVGHAAFDAVVDPSGTAEESSRNQAKGFQLALRNYLEDCADKGEECPVGDDPKQAEKTIGKLLTRLDKKPMPTGAGRPLTEALATNGIAQALYSEDLWQYLTDGLREALDDGNGTTLLVLADALNGRNQDGSYSTLQSSLTAISCADTKERYDAADIRKALPDFRSASPVFGPQSAWGMTQCKEWPVEGKSKSLDVSAEGADTILLVGTTGDPATPYEGTRRMKQMLGDDVAVEVTYRGEGHGAYDSKNRCVQQKVNDYLLKDKAPKDGSTCD